MTYAAGTSVPVEKSKAELDQILSKHGASQRGFFADDDAGLAVVTFSIARRSVRIELPLPKLQQFSGVKHARRIPHPQAMQKAWEQACRERWRLLVLAVKAKLELVAIGVSSHEQEFLAGILLADGRTVGETIKPALVEAYATGKTPQLLQMNGAVDGILEEP